MLYMQIAVYVYQLDDFLITPSNVKKSGEPLFNFIYAYVESRELHDHLQQVQLHEQLQRMLGDQKSSTEDLQQKIQIQERSYLGERYQMLQVQDMHT